MVRLKKILVVIGLVALMALMGSAVFAAGESSASVTIHYTVAERTVLDITAADAAFAIVAPSTAGTVPVPVAKNWAYAFAANENDSTDTKTISAKVSKAVAGLTFAAKSAVPAGSSGTAAASGGYVDLSTSDATLVDGIQYCSEGYTVLNCRLSATAQAINNAAGTATFTLTVTNITVIGP